MDTLDRAIVNRLQEGLPICEHPYAVVAEALGTDEATLITRLAALRADGVLSRFGPLYNAERMGGALTLAAMAVPDEDYDRVAAAVNAHPEVAHNYARAHDLNMWFVLAAEHPARIPEIIAEIERETGCQVHDMPRLAEFHVGLRLEA